MTEPHSLSCIFVRMSTQRGTLVRETPGGYRLSKLSKHLQQPPSQVCLTAARHIDIDPSTGARATNTDELDNQLCDDTRRHARPCDHITST